MIHRLLPLHSDMIDPYCFVHFSNVLCGLSPEYQPDPSYDIWLENSTHYSFGISFPSSQCAGGPGGKDLLKDKRLRHVHCPHTASTDKIASSCRRLMTALLQWPECRESSDVLSYELWSWVNSSARLWTGESEALLSMFLTRRWETRGKLWIFRILSS